MLEIPVSVFHCNPSYSLTKSMFNPSEWLNRAWHWLGQPVRELDGRIEYGTGLGNRCVNWMVESSVALAWGGVRELDGRIIFHLILFLQLPLVKGSLVG